jgi:hypothetical protein
MIQRLIIDHADIVPHLRRSCIRLVTAAEDVAAEIIPSPQRGKAHPRYLPYFSFASIPDSLIWYAGIGSPEGDLSTALYGLVNISNGGT